MLRSVLFVALGLVASSALPQPVTLKVNMFPTSPALPVLAAASQGIFEKHGVKVEPIFTRTSQEQRDGLARGEFQLAQAAVDNAVAMVETAKQDVIIVSGGDSSGNELFVQPEIGSFGDLRGQVLLVDAPNTAYALQLKKMMLINGLKEGADYQIHSLGATLLRLKAMRENKTYKGTMLNPPFSIEARTDGMKSLGRAVDALGAYQAAGIFVMRTWARGNSDVLERFLAGLIEGTRWVLNPSHRAAAAKILSDRLKVPANAAEETLVLISDPKFGLAPDARFDMQGFRNVLALRAEIAGSWGGKAPAPDKYVDLSYYDNAMKLLSR